MRLGFVTAYPPSRGSLNEYGYHLATALRQVDAIDLTVLADWVDEPTNDPQDVKRCWEFNRPSNAMRILRHARRHDVDALLYNVQFASFGDHMFAAGAGLCAPLMGARSGVPSVVLLHNLVDVIDLDAAGMSSGGFHDWMVRQGGRQLTKMLGAADLIAVTLPRYEYILREKYGFDNVVLVPHGSFESDPEPLEEPPATTPRILAFGKFGTYKRIETLLEASDLLRAGGVDHEVIVAGSDNPNCEGYLAEMQKRCEGNDNITFYGYVEEEDVPLLFRDSHVAVFPYTATTGSSGVLHQAGSYGRACVLPRFGDFVDLIDHEGYAAELFEPGDAPSLAQALHRVIADQQLMHGIGETNYLAASSLPMQEIAAWYELQLRAVLTNKGKRRGTHGLGHWHVGNAAAA